MSDEPIEQDPKAELQAMSSVLGAVEGLSADGVTRVLNWVAESLGVAVLGPRGGPGRSVAPPSGTADGGAGAHIEEASMGCSDAASFLDKSGASDGNERAIAVAYWIQVVEGKESWASAEVNKELKHQGYALANVTATLDRVMKKKPAFVVQLKKSGNSQQARKLYKLTSAGEKAVVTMFSRAEAK